MTKKVKIIIAVVLGVGVLGAGGFFAYKYLYKTPKKVVAAMQEKMSSKETETYHYKMDNLTLSGETDDEPFNIKLSAEGDIDKLDINNPKTKNDISGSFETGGITFSGQLEIRTIEDELYFIIKEIPNIPLEYIPIDLSFLENEWIKVSSSDFSGLYGEDMELNFSKFFNELIKEAEFSEIKALKPETVSGVKCYHYQVIIDKDALLEFMKKNIDIITGEEMTLSNKKSLEELLDNIDELSAELWIGKKDNLLYKTKSKFNIKIPDTKDKIGVNLEITLSDYNKPIEVEKPKKTKSLEDIMTEYYMNWYGGESLYEMPEYYYETPDIYETPTFP